MSVADTLKSGIETAKRVENGSASQIRVRTSHLSPEQFRELLAATLEFLRTRDGKKSKHKGWRVLVDSQIGVLTWWKAEADLKSGEQVLRRLRNEVFERLRTDGVIFEEEGPGPPVRVKVAGAAATGSGGKSAKAKLTPDDVGAWLLKANPKTWDITRWVRETAGRVDDQDAKIDDWTIQDNYRSWVMDHGQRAVLWVSGDGKQIEPGIWGVGWVTGPSYWGQPVAGDYWLDEEARKNADLFADVDIALLGAPVSRAAFMSSAVLCGAEVVKAAWASNPSYLTPEEFAALLDLLGGPEKYPALPTSIDWETVR